MSQPPRTLAVLHLAEPSGPSTDFAAHLYPLAERDSLEVVVPGPGRVASSFRRMAPVAELQYSALTTPRGPVAFLRLVRRLVGEVRVFRAHIRVSRPDVVVIATTALPAVAIAARLERVPTLVYAAEVVTGRASRRSLPGAVAGRALLSANRRAATTVVACSHTVAQQFRGGADDLVTVYPPIDDSYSGGDRASFRAEHGIGPEEPCVAVVGNITRGRGQDIAIRALPLIREAIPSVRCAIVGSPFPRRQDLAFEGELRRLAANAGVAEAVVFTGFCDRIANAYAAADVVVNPARFPEPFGRAACEALVAGRPVVASRVGAIPEVLRDGETAVVVPPEDPDALAANVVQLLADRDYGDRIASAGRRDVLERFAAEQSGRLFRRAVESTAG
ncbi:MAG TPA: glycosyltransferase family 4 protein [Solirubrobacterales bacterium]|nr:glycosyltransferase family 4 protein [Solirubrobacterales bacterium]